MSDYRKLQVWSKAHQLTIDIYRISIDLPKSELYGLQAQMRRASASIAANLAEGSGRSTDRDFARFVSHAIGSACELEYQLTLSQDLGYLEEPEVRLVQDQVSEVRRMMRSLRHHLNSEGA
jgi:four helix bundle protein